MQETNLLISADSSVVQGISGLMGFWDKGFLNLDVDSSSPLTMTINIFISGTSLLVQCVIAIMAIIKMKRNQQINMKLSGCLVASLFCACTNSVSSLALIVAGDARLNDLFIDRNTCTNDPFIVVPVVFVFSLGCFWECMLCTFILKLYLTFKGSVYEMSCTMARVFTIITFMIFVILLAFCIMMFCFEMRRYGVLYFTLAMTNGVFCITGSALAVHFFVSTLGKLGKAQETTLRDLSVTQNDIKLKPQQQKLTDLAAKSMLLFGIQTVSTIFISMISAWAFPFTNRIAILTIDMSINLFCVYLQFAFAEKHYRKCCGFCDERFRSFISRRTQNAVYKHSFEWKQRQEQMEKTGGTHRDVPSQSI